MSVLDWSAPRGPILHWLFPPALPLAAMPRHDPPEGSKLCFLGGRRVYTRPLKLVNLAALDTNGAMPPVRPTMAVLTFTRGAWRNADGSVPDLFWATHVVGVAA